MLRMYAKRYGSIFSFPWKDKDCQASEAQLQGDEGAWETSLLISKVTAHVKTIALIV